jgi:hypothetical protein
MLAHGSEHPAPKEVAMHVEQQMKYLTDCGIISGHEEGDYI